MKLIQRSMLRELIGPVVLTILLITFVLISRRLDDFISALTLEQIGWQTVLKLFALLVPFMLTMTLPMGLLIACLIVFSRWNMDRELLALRVSGITLWRMVIPLVILGLLCSGLVFYFTTQLVPWTYTEFRRSLFRVAASLSQNLREQSFHRLGNNLVVFVQEEESQSGTYHGMTLFYSKEGKLNQILTAEKGTVSINLDKEETLLGLEKGAFYKLDEKNPEHFFIGTFDRWISITNLDRILPSPNLSDLKPREYKLPALREKIQSDMKTGKSSLIYRIEYIRRFAIPLACIVFVLIGFPLGVSWKIKNKIITFIMGLSFILIYWIFMEFSKTIALKEILQPELTIWLPDIIFGSLGIYLTWRICRQ